MLSPEDRKALADCERVIAAAEDHVQAVVKAYDVILSRQLYRPAYPDFATYCKARWTVVPPISFDRVIRAKA